MDALPAGIPAGFDLTRIEGDENCLFKAVAVSLGFAPDDYHYMSLKFMALQEVMAHPEILNSIVGDTPTYMLNIVTSNENLSDLVTLNILARVLGVRFKIVHTGRAPVDIPATPGALPTLYLHCNAEAHYDAYTASAAADSSSEGSGGAAAASALVFAPSSPSIPTAARHVVAFMPPDPVNIIVGIARLFPRFIMPNVEAFRVALKTLTEKYPRPAAAVAAPSMEPFMLIAQVASGLLGTNVLKALRHYTFDADSPAYPYTEFDAYYQNLMLLQDATTARTSLPELFVVDLIAGDLQKFLIVRIMHMLELYAQIQHMPIDLLSSAYPAGRAPAKEADLKKGISNRLIDEILRDMLTYRIYEYQTVLEQTKETPGATTEDTIAAQKVILDCLAEAILVAMSQRAEHSQALIIPVHSKTHQAYILMIKPTEDGYCLILHNYGAGATGAKIHPLQIDVSTVDAGGAAAGASDSSRTAVKDYLIKVFKLLKAATYHDIDRVLKAGPTGAAMHPCHTFSRPGQPEGNCVAYGYESAHLHATMGLGNEWQQWLRRRELELVAIRSTLRGFTGHWPHPASIEPSFIREVETLSPAKPSEEMTELSAAAGGI